MFTCRNISLTFGLVLALVIAAGMLLSSLWFVIAGLVIAVSAWLTILILGSLNITWNFYLFSYGHGDPEIPTVAITFDDGPHPEHTFKVLDVLDKYQVKAAFFCIGKRVRENPEILKQITERGHITGNHSYNHSPWFDFYSAKKIVNEIRKTDEVMEGITGNKPLFFRPPFGVTNPQLLKALNTTGHLSVSWRLRSFDTVKSPESVIRKITRKVKGGDIVLLHDRLPASARVVEEFLMHCMKSGIRIVPLDELLNYRKDEITD
jgi:peptidoglycan/xylan/chitin deacetylase (PgdA/CDA1 family)